MKQSETAERLARVRKHMAKMGVEAMLVRSTDRFLNEYVPTDESARVWLSGFTGSMGELVVSKQKAWLAVDGRYWTQAEKQTDAKCFEVSKVPLGTSIDQRVGELLAELAPKGRKKLQVGFEPDKTTPKTLEYLERLAGERVEWRPLFPSPVEVARGVDRPAPRELSLRAVDEARVGATVRQKLDRLAEDLKQLDVEGLVVQRLDQIAYLTNLRGDELPFQATFKALALATPETLFVAMDPSRVPREVRVVRSDLLFMPEAELWTLMGRRAKRKRIGYDPEHNTVLIRGSIAETGATPVPLRTPLIRAMAKKNEAELSAMREAFQRADSVVQKVQSWLCQQVVEGQRVTEYDFAREVRRTFLDAGATGLSFKVISAAGKNGAVIHYSDPSRRRVIKRGELLLLDTGAYFEEGYATDLTRTFLVDDKRASASPEQRKYYTLVLKAAIAGLSAVFPEGTTGAQLDAIVRAPLWAAGLNYNHGTGHGVGINVHEFPPRVAPGSPTPLEPGFVFSIEPGVYLPAFGGVRIENLCTVRPAVGKPGFLEVQPLTFSPLDKRLIDTTLLDAHEKRWLSDYGKRHRAKNPRGKSSKARRAAKSRPRA